MFQRIRAAALVVVLSMLASSCVYLARVSTLGDGSETSADIFIEAISGSARFVVFRTQSPLDPIDTNSNVDLYRKDTLTGAVDLVTISSTGGASNGNASRAEISDDGTRVAYRTGASNMVSGDTNAVDDLYVRDLDAGTTTRVTVDQLGAQLPSTVIAFDISGDGSMVVWTTSAQVTTTPPLGAAVYKTDLASGSIEEVSTTQAGVLRSGGNPSASYDGETIAFSSGANDLVSGDTNGVQDVFVKLPSGAVHRASTATGGAQSTSPSFFPAMSGNAAVVAFSTDMAFDPIDTNNVRDIYVKTITGATVLASVADDGSIGSASSQSFEISHDGTLVSFTTTSPELTGAAGSAAIVRDGLNETTTVVSRDGTGAISYDGSEPHLNAGGDYVAWGALTEVVAGEPDSSAIDVFLRWWSSPRIDSVSPSTLSRGVSTTITIEGSGFRPDALLYTNPVANDGIVFSNITVVDDETITATIDVVLGTATPGVKWVNLQWVGTGPGVLKGAFFNCQCLTITP